jgi:hypothetical protein
MSAAMPRHTYLAEMILRVGESQIRLLLWHRPGLRIFFDGGQPVLQRPDAGRRNVVAQIADFCRSKLAFFCVQHQAMSLQPGQNYPDVMLMLLVVCRSDQDIVQVNKTEGETGDDVVHHTLKGLAGVSQPKRHPQKFV